MDKLLKDLHYISVGIAEARLKLNELKGTEDMFHNTELCLMGANSNIETAIGELYQIKEENKLKQSMVKEKHE